ncbi:hypothetical protein Plo01_16180 [Planobispora longispora]|uniref:Uncharacterized protein n=1 Tax=Planobispora longispora TaxID=28887 RepID=A0A8J3RKB7_9ACTN|nr:hypothetical protein Plo01_16180 [Planobispora longispora]
MHSDTSHAETAAMVSEMSPPGLAAASTVSSEPAATGPAKANDRQPFLDATAGESTTGEATTLNTLRSPRE